MIGRHVAVHVLKGTPRRSGGTGRWAPAVLAPGRGRADAAAARGHRLIVQSALDDLLRAVVGLLWARQVAPGIGIDEDLAGSGRCPEAGGAVHYGTGQVALVAEDPTGGDPDAEEASIDRAAGKAIVAQVGQPVEGGGEELCLGRQREGENGAFGGGANQERIRSKSDLGERQQDQLQDLAMQLVGSLGAADPAVAGQVEDDDALDAATRGFEGSGDQARAGREAGRWAE